MTYSTTRHSLFTLTLTAAVMLAGCDAPPDDPEQTTVSATDGDTEGPTSDTAEPTSDTEGPTSDTEEPTSDTEEPTGGEGSGEGLFACGLDSSCAEIFWHLDPNDDPQPVACAAELILSGEPGLIMAREAPGPDINETQTFVFVIGDGTAVVQTRFRSCDEPGCWEEPSAVSQCDIAGTEALMAACDAGDTCEWWPWGNLENCADIDAPTCEELAASLASM